MVTAAVVVLMMVDVPSAHTLICMHALEGGKRDKESTHKLRFASLWPN
jgi:hypothetical protein